MQCVRGRAGKSAQNAGQALAPPWALRRSEELAYSNVWKTCPARPAFRPILHGKNPLSRCRTGTLTSLVTAATLLRGSESIVRTGADTVLQPATLQDVPGSALLRRSFRKTFPPAVRGQGAYLWDARGKQYLDLSGSMAVNFIGHGVAEIVAAMTQQARSVEFVHNSQFTTPIAEEYARELLDFAGPAYAGGAVYFTCGGSEAVEIALKLAREYQVEIGNFSHTQIISREQSHHGATLGTL